MWWQLQHWYKRIPLKTRHVLLHFFHFFKIPRYQLIWEKFFHHLPVPTPSGYCGGAEWHRGTGAPWICHFRLDFLNLQTPTMVNHISYNHIWGELIGESLGAFQVDELNFFLKGFRDFNLKLLFEKGCLGWWSLKTRCWKNVVWKTLKICRGDILRYWSLLTFFCKYIYMYIWILNRTKV